MTLAWCRFQNGESTFQERLSVGIVALGTVEVCKIAQRDSYSRMVEAEYMLVDNKSTPPKRLGLFVCFLQKEESCQTVKARGSQRVIETEFHFTDGQSTS